MNPLPSNPDQIISLRESTVKDVIDFSDFTADHEEEATSMFLNRMQPKETRLDAKLWTAEDRRTLLFWYWIHSTADPSGKSGAVSSLGHWPERIWNTWNGDVYR